MSTPIIKDLLADLAARGVCLSLRDGKLHCEAPRGAVTPELRDVMTSRKEAILSFLRGGSTGVAASAGAPAQRIDRVTRGAPIPLSYSQQRLWLQSQMDGGSASYNMPIALRIDGSLNVSALEGALAEVVRRHEVLRTSFAVEGEQPAQVVHPETVVELAKHDLRDHPEPARSLALDRLMADEALHCFDLAVAPLMRAALVRTAPREHVLLITMHHMISDGWSLGIFVDEMKELYGAALRNRPSPMSTLPVQYADFAAWQRRRLGAAELSSLRSYWVNELADAPPVLDLPTDRPRSGASSLGGGTERFTLSPGLVADLRTLSNKAGTTLFMTLLAGFVTLLGRYSNQTDIVVGSPVSTRNHPDLERLIGMFVNTLALRVSLDGDPTFATVLERVRRTATGAYAHQELPFDHVVEALRPSRVSGQHPIFQVMFISQNAPASVPDAAGLRFELLEHDRFAAKFDLMLEMTETPDGVRGIWEYRRDLFDVTTIRRATEHLKALLSAMAADSEQRVLSAPLLTSAERREMLDAWNDTSASYPNRCLHELFEAQARRSPDAVAVTSGDARVTYGELNARVNGIARDLSARGVARGAYVAVLLPRSPDLLASLLAILKAGAAYLPLDPSHPDERIGHMLDDARPSAVLTHGAMAGRLARRPEPIVVLDGAEPSISAATTDAASVPVTLEDTAYVLYTSGSTGKPKGAIITHRGLTNYLSWCTEAYGVDGTTASAVSTSIGFDATVTSLFAPLLVGGTVVLLPEGEENEVLATLLQFDPRPLLAKLTPAHIDVLRALAPVPVRTSRPRTFVIGGEQLLEEHVAWCRAAAPEAKLFNEYGPTETVVGCCVYEVPNDAGVRPGESVPIGRPIANTQLYIVNEWLEPVPVGVAGELYIGGAGVARGYLHRPELTEERFVPNPFSTDPRARLYRTGDRASYLADGTLRFHGRLDAQVKVRGFRIELGEIEAVLTQTAVVHQAAVVVREAGSGRSRLVAYIVPTDSYAGEAALREALARHLPEYMIPDELVALAALPLSPNGKVDRRALPVPAAERNAQATESEAPQTELELALSAIWVELLKVPRVTVADNFFRLGGDSIVGIQLVARARQFGIHITPKQLVENPTVQQLARVAVRKASASAEQGPISGNVPFTAIQRWMFELGLEEPHHFNQSVMVTVPGDFDITALERAILAVVNHHDMLRARFPLVDGGYKQVIAPPVGRVDVRREDLSRVPEADRLQAIEAAASRKQGTLSLADGPLFAPSLIHFGPGEPARLLLTTHHLLVDGVSWRLLLEDIVRAYTQAAAGAPVALPPKTTSFRAWSARMGEYARSAEMDSQRAYWLGAASQPSKRLPLDLVESDAGRADVASVVTVTLSADETDNLRRDALAVFDADAQELLLTALTTAFAEDGDDTNLTVDMESHGRADVFEQLDVSRTVGWFTSVFPVSFALRGDERPSRVLARVKERLRSVPSRGIGYGLLRYLGADEDLRARLAALPPAQVSFNYFGQLDRAQPVGSEWALAPESCGPTQNPAEARRHVIEVNASILAGRLVVDWTYSERLHRRETVERLAEKFARALRELLRDGPADDRRELTPVDVPDLDMSEDALAHVLAEVARAHAEGSHDRE